MKNLDLRIDDFAKHEASRRSALCAPVVSTRWQPTPDWRALVARADRCAARREPFLAAPKNRRAHNKYL